MAKHNCELFGHFSYDSELTYNELYALEADLIDELQEALEESGAEHIDTVGMGDALRMQCVFSEYEEEFFHSVCDSVAKFIPVKVRARFLFVDKNLDTVHLYFFEKKGWKEAVLDVSPNACSVATSS